MGNLTTASRGSFSFRFDRGAYIATVVVSPDGSFLHHTSGEESVDSAQHLIPRIPGITVKSGSNVEVEKAMRALIGDRAISELTVIHGTASEPDSVRLIFTDGSFVMMAFKTGSLVAIEHIPPGEERFVYAVQGKDPSHKRINLALSASGEDAIYSQPQTAPVFEIKLPDIAQFLE